MCTECRKLGLVITRQL